MAGYMTKMHGNIYEGEMRNGGAAAIKNGQLVVAGTSTNVGKMLPASAADTSTKLLLKEITTIYDGVKAYRFVVNALAKPYYLVENGHETPASLEYDHTDYETPVGALLRAHPLAVGDEFVTTVVTGTLSAGTEYGVKATGEIG